MSSPELVEKARDRVRLARSEGGENAVPGLVLERLLDPAATNGVELKTIVDKVDAGGRITPEEGLWLLTDAPLLMLAPSKPAMVSPGEFTYAVGWVREWLKAPGAGS